MKRGEWSFLDAMWRCAAATADACWTQAAGREAIAQAREGRLANLIERTRRESAFYRRAWKGLGERTARLADLPAVSKADLMAGFDDWVTDPAVTRERVERFAADPARIGEPFLGRYAIFSSSGTTGVPGLVVQDPDALAVYDALGATRLAAFAPSWNWREPLAGHRFALVAATEGHFAGVVAWERLRALHPWFAAHARVFPVTRPLRETCAALQAFRPSVVASYATVLRALAGEKDAGRLDIAPAALWYGGEWLAPMSRAHIERAFSAPVAGDYGASEFPAIAFECERGALHLNDDWVVLEPVDARGEPVPPDTPSASVLLTSLANRVQPLVRYELGDSVTLVSKPCACARPFPVIRVDGRRDEILRLRAGRGREVPVLPMALCTAIEEGAGVHRFQAIQAGPGELVLRVEDGTRQREAVARAKRALEEFLATQGLAGVAVRAEAATLAAHPVSGKFRQVWRAKVPAAEPTSSRPPGRGFRRPRSGP
ncbi:MAG: phenylacetate--CoA ligase family protein [Burkholderiales bacterium]